MDADKFELESKRALFKVGAVVALKSGGPTMTVEMWRQDNLVMTQWFDGASHVRDCFDPACIVLSNDPLGIR